MRITYNKIYTTSSGVSHNSYEEAEKYLKELIEANLSIIVKDLTYNNKNIMKEQLRDNLAIIEHLGANVRDLRLLRESKDS